MSETLISEASLCFVMTSLQEFIHEQKLPMSPSNHITFQSDMLTCPSFEGGLTNKLQTATPTNIYASLP
jgi:hypothetical protein